MSETSNQPRADIDKWESLIDTLRHLYPEFEWMDDFRLCETVQDRIEQLAQVPSEERTPLENDKVALLPTISYFME